LQAIEFTSKIQDGMMSIPEHYKDWFKKPVKMLAMEPSPEENVIPQKTTDLNRFAGTISLTEGPLEFQKRIRGNGCESIFVGYQHHFVLVRWTFSRTIARR